MTRMEEIHMLAQVLAEGDYQKHKNNGVSLNPFTTVGARHDWQRGFDGDAQRSYEALDYNTEYQRGKAARQVLKTKGGEMKHKHEKYIKLMADGVRIETDVNGEWIVAYWGDFNDNNLTFRISPKQPADKDGWIQWFGGDNPAVGKLVDIFSRGGNDSNWLADNLDWRHTKGSGDITRYRIVKQKKWRWMYTIASNNSTDCLYLTNAMTEAEVKEWVARRGMTTLGPRQDWTEVCDE